VTASDFRFIVTEQMEAAGIAPGAILIEPAPRNTAPAILAGVLHIAATDPGALVLVAPSDHLIPDPQSFREAVAAGIPAARAGRIVCLTVLTHVGKDSKAHGSRNHFDGRASAELAD